MISYYLAFIINRGRCYLCNKFEDIICQRCFLKLIPYDKKESLNGYKINSFFNYNQIASKILITSKYPPYNFYILKFLVGKLSKLCFPKNTVFCPVPLSSQKMFDRKFNQAELIASYLAKENKFPILNLLKRIRDSKPLFSLNKKLRQKEVAKIFRISLLGRLLYNKEILTVVLIDDLITTGETLKECVLELKLAGYKNIEILTLFRA